MRKLLFDQDGVFRMPRFLFAVWVVCMAFLYFFPEAQAQDWPHARWEYKRLEIGKMHSAMPRINQEGSLGWEVIWVHNNGFSTTFLLKRRSP